VGAASGVAQSGVNPRERAKPQALEKSTLSHRAGDFVLTNELREQVRDLTDLAPTIDLEAEAEKFRNYYGRDATTFRNLPKAWRNWVTRAVEFEKRARSPGPRRESVEEHNRRVFAELEDMDETAIRVMQGLDPDRGST